ncbi:MAG: exopolyphosphatase [Desulfuromonadaceae bacterium]|nr:exopolyphosphatase [Desulfuromonadaceae bacterium]MDD2847879.1 exopolyphosphatase [Desulfuromonadaceae bacterium]MDD4129576.1 exopolyphosphatase [Desulfuromonadaceae bacterium]
MNDYCASIDFGTNTARLLIAVRSPAGITPVRVERQVVRLGGGFTDESGLSAEAWERGLDCLRRFSGIIAEYGVTRVRASATSAVRDAINGRAFVAKVLAETGITLDVIDGDVEARLTLRGVLSGLDSESDTIVVLDVGGGSTEFTVASKGSPVFIKSMPIGVVRLTEGFRASDEMLGRVHAVVDQLEKDLFSAGMVIAGDSELVGTAGTATTIAAIKLEMVDYDYRKVNNYTVSRTDIGEIYERLSKLSPVERLSIKGVEKGREDLIIAGLVVILSVMDRFGFKRLKVSDFGLLEGLALTTA